MPGASPDHGIRSEPAPPDTPWYETPAAMVVAGIGGVVAIGALVWAILMTAHQSGVPAQPERLTPVTPTKPSSTRPVTTTTSTTPFRTPVSTSEDTGPPSAPPPPPPQEGPAETTPPATTTMSNPYATTTVPNAGAF